MSAQDWIELRWPSASTCRRQCPTSGRGRLAIGVDRAAPAAKLIGVSTDYLLGMTDDPTLVDRRGSSSEPAPNLANDQHDPALVPNGTPGARPIPIRELAAAAGGGALDLDETIRGYLYFRREWLDRQAIDPTQADVIKGQRRVDGVDAAGRLLDPTRPPPAGAAQRLRRPHRRGRRRQALTPRRRPLDGPDVLDMKMYDTAVVKWPGYADAGGADGR